MVRVSKRPEGFFKDLSERYIWTEFYDKKGIYAYVAFCIIDNEAYFHTQFIRWNHKIAKDTIKGWNQLVRFCKSRGVNRLIASNKDLNDTRWPKFIRLFGFKEPYKILISIQGV